MKRWTALVLSLCLLLLPLSAAAAEKEALVLAYSEEEYDVPARYEYNAQGQLLRKVQEQWHTVTEYEYYPEGGLKTERLLRLGEEDSVLSYDRKGNVSRYVYGMGAYTTEYVNYYDDLGRLALRQWTQGDTAHSGKFTYEEDGGYALEYCLYLSGELNSRKTTVYDAEGRKTAIKIDLLNGRERAEETTIRYDGKGNLLHFQREVRRDDTVETEILAYKNTCDAAGRRTKTEVSRSLTTKTAGKVTGEEKLSPWCTVTCAYDAAGNLIKESYAYTDGTLPHENLWSYDAQGNLLEFSGRLEVDDPFGFPTEEYFYTRIRYEYLPLSQVQAK